jgi:hypothetical protein
MRSLAGGVIFRFVPPYRSRLLAHWTSGGTKLGPLEKWLFTGLSNTLDRRYYAPAATTEEREWIKSLCMARGSAIGWAKHYLSLGFPDRFTASLPMFAEIEKVLGTGAVRTVHQVGCCSGREIAWFAQRYANVAFVGSDCDEALVQFLREHWKHVPNLTFELVRMEKESPRDASVLKCDLLYASGGFHYMDPASLLGFFQRTKPLAGRLYLSQPMDRAFSPGTETASRGRGMLSWNHPYPALLLRAGWKNVRLAEGFVEDLPHFKNVAVFADGEA